MNEIIVKSSNALTPKQLSVIVSYATKKYAKDFEIRNIVDENLIGGIIIYFEGEVVDASYATQIRKVKKLLDNEE